MESAIRLRAGEARSTLERGLRRAALTAAPGHIRARPGYLALLGGIAGLVVILLLSAAPHGPAPSDPVAIDGLAEVVVAVLGLSLTVVAIVVQLAAQRYSAKVVDLFMSDATNAFTFSFMVASCVYVVVLPALFPVAGAPWPAVALGFALAVANFALLLPYVRYVFSFLSPDNIIRTIEGSAHRSFAAAAARGRDPEVLSASRRAVAGAIERIADNCLAAVGHQDRNLALHTVRTLERLVCRYHEGKAGLPPAWAEVEILAFASLSEGFYEEIVAEGIWVEAKALMEFEHIIRRALGGMDELVSQIASSTRVIGVRALDTDDIEVVRLVIRFFNTFIRHGLNAGNVRAIYNVLEHLRRLTVTLLRDRPELAFQITEHLHYYAHRASESGYPFVSEIIAHDVRVLCEEVYVRAPADVVRFVDRFLDLDQRPESAGGELALLGVRKAQAILGAFFLDQGEDALAAKIRDDMRGESSARLRRIRDGILAVTERRFWEITDRGFNFDYVDEGRRGSVGDFFEPLLRDREEEPPAEPMPLHP